MSNATSWVQGRHNVRFGIQAQFRKFDHLTEVPPRGGFTFNGQFTGNPVADFLLGYCSTCTGAFGSSRSNYRSPTFAPFIDDNWQVSSELTLQIGLALGIPRHRGHEQNDQEGSFDPATGKIAYHVVPTNLPPQLVPLVINQDDFFPCRHSEKGPEQLRTARRRRVQRSTTRRSSAPASASTTTTST